MATFINLGGGDYEVITDSDPKFVNEIAIYILNAWKEFAEGGSSINGKRIEHPTGRYAASITMTGDGQTSIKISSPAPVAKAIELGHGFIDMKKYLEWGRKYPMHRGAREFTGFSPPVPLSRKTYAMAWVIPPMEPYAPAEYLARLASRLLK